MKTFAFALLMVTLTVPGVAGQTPDPTASTDAEVTDLLADYVGRIENDQMSLMVVHLNDFTTDAFFSAPTKYSLRAQARQNTMFFVVGVAKRDMSVDTDYELVQYNELTGERVAFRAVAVNIFNFEPGASVVEGERFQGIVSAPAQGLDLKAPFDVRFGEISVRFELSGDAVDRIQQ